MIDVKTSRNGDMVTAVVAGSIDMRASGDFEKALLTSVEEGGRRVIIDFEKVDLLTSAGIRVLVTLSRRLQGAGGALVLFSLGPAVLRVFEISGLTTQFKIAATRAEAVSALGSKEPAPRRTRGSRLSQVVGTLLGGRQGAPNAPVNPRPTGGTQSRLSTQVVRLLGGRPTDPRK
jgi:anti-sigma B factor antagonist